MKQGSTYKRGNVWWIQYYCQGRKIRESSYSSNEVDAGRLLKKRLGEIAQGKAPGVFYDRVKFDELATDLRTDYKVNDRKSIPRMERSLGHLEKEFAGSRVPTITTAAIKAYIEKRLRAGMSNAIINRELAALKRAFNLGRASDKVDRVPHIPMLAERNVRKGFFEADQFQAVLKALPDYLKAPALFTYYTGMRASEVFSLTWSQVNLREGYIRLEPGDTKSGEGRTVYLAGEALQALKAAHSARRLDCPLVFHRKGHRIRDYHKTWNEACETAGCPGLLFHDLRRTAVRNMVRAGVPERVAMMVSGHKTRAIFDRYNIVSDSDLKDAARKVADYQQAQNGHNFGHSRTETANSPKPTGDKTPGRSSGARGGSRTRTG